MQNFICVLLSFKCVAQITATFCISSCAVFAIFYLITEIGSMDYVSNSIIDKKYDLLIGTFYWKQFMK